MKKDYVTTIRTEENQSLASHSETVEFTGWAKIALIRM